MEKRESMQGRQEPWSYFFIDIFVLTLKKSEVFSDGIPMPLSPSLRSALFMRLGECQKDRTSHRAPADKGSGENPRQAADFLRSGSAC
jgi:hypothetical protein